MCVTIDGFEGCFRVCGIKSRKADLSDKHDVQIAILAIHGHVVAELNSSYYGYA